MTPLGRSLTRAVSLCGLVLMLCMPSPAAAQNRVGGHFGAVFPLVSHGDGQTVNISDDFNIGFPMGITIKNTGRLAFDLELVPVLDFHDDGPISTPLTIHPGVLASFGRWTSGLRLAVDVGGASWGFTPLLNRGFGEGLFTYFGEVVVPIRFKDDDLGDTQTSVGLGVHIGVGF